MPEFQLKGTIKCECIKIIQNDEDFNQEEFKTLVESFRENQFIKKIWFPITDI